MFLFFASSTSSSSTTTPSMDYDYDSWLMECVSIYGMQLLVGALLSAVTIFRREMSCNRVFHNEEGEERDPVNSDNDTEEVERQRLLTLLLQTETEQLLDGAGMYCSGKSIQALMAAVTLWKIQSNSDNVNHHDDDTERRIEQQHRDANCTHTSACRSSCVTATSTEELLDRAGNYCSGEPILAATTTILCYLLLHHAPKEEQERLEQQQQQLQCSTKQDQTQHTFDPLTKGLPPDVHVHIASFLYPKEVVTLSMVSKAYHALVDDEQDSPTTSSSKAIWTNLWKRDYAWVLDEWNVGQQALQRSLSLLPSPAASNKNNNSASPSAETLSSSMMLTVTKDMYFEFGECFVNYLLAGQNTMERCLVGLHSQIYDLTPFLHDHPGSPDTLMVHAGKEASRFFEDMGHSQGARRLAKTFCVVADLSQQQQQQTQVQTQESASASSTNGPQQNPPLHTMTSPRSYPGWGLRPTRHTTGWCEQQSQSTTTTSTNRIPVVFEAAGEDLHLGRRQRSKGDMLYRVRHKLDHELAAVDTILTKRYGGDTTILGSVNPYYDPFRKKWCVWYTNEDLQTVFADVVV